MPIFLFTLLWINSTQVAILNFDESETVLCLGFLDSEPWERWLSNRRLLGEEETVKKSQVPWAFSSRLTLPCLTIEHTFLDWLFTSFQISVILPSSELTKSYRFCFSDYPAFTHVLFFPLYSYYSLFVYMFPLQNSVLDFLSMRLQSCYVPNLQKKNTKIILRVGIANHIIFFYGKVLLSI